MNVWLIAATVLVVIGALLFVGVMMVCNWDFTRLSTVKYETTDFEADQNFSKISINTDTADIVFLPSADNICRVFCYEQENRKHSVSIENDTLTVNLIDGRKWYEYIGISFGTPKITVYLSKGQYYALSVQESTGDIEIPVDLKFENIDIQTSTGNVTNLAYASGSVNIKTSTGDICVKNANVENMDLSVSTGRITAENIACKGNVKITVSTGKTNLSDITCKNIFSEGNTGSLSLKNVVATDFLSVERTTGDIKFDGCDAGKIHVKTDTGAVTGSFLTGKVFVTHTDTGKVDTPNTTTGGTCEIYTSTGDIKISLDW